eukprot:m.130465 g.130465  ORF g.130465 m.130465 type:complete len:66 (+) comp14604_c0_seq2:3522-3719(+)
MLPFGDSNTNCAGNWTTRSEEKADCVARFHRYPPDRGISSWGGPGGPMERRAYSPLAVINDRCQT